MTTVAGIMGTRRRQHDRAFEADLVEQCLAPVESVAEVALAGGVNAKLLFKWRRDYLRSKELNRPATSSSTVLVPVQIAMDMDVEASNSQASVPPVASSSYLSGSTIRRRFSCWAPSSHGCMRKASDRGAICLRRMAPRQLALPRRMFQARQAPDRLRWLQPQQTRKNRISTRSGYRAPVPTNTCSVIQRSDSLETSKLGMQRK